MICNCEQVSCETSDFFAVGDLWFERKLQEKNMLFHLICDYVKETKKVFEMIELWFVATANRPNESVLFMKKRRWQLMV